MSWSGGAPELDVRPHRAEQPAASATPNGQYEQESQPNLTQ